MKNVSYAIAVICSSLIINACDVSANGANNQPLSAPATPDKQLSRQPKEPGCQTLVDMGQLDNTFILDVAEKTLENAVDEYTQNYASQKDALVLRNKNVINSCVIHQIHVKNMAEDPTSPKQAIYSFLEEQKTGKLLSAGAKVTCWKDDIETWRPIADCK